MKLKRIPWNWLVGLSLLFGFLAFSMLREWEAVQFYFPRMLILPTADSIGHRYLDAVINNDLQAALALTNGTATCKESMTRSFNDSAEQFAGMQLDWVGVRVTYFPDEPGSELVHVVFQERFYDDDGSHLKNHGDAALKTNYSPFGGRHTCGRSRFIE